MMRISNPLPLSFFYKSYIISIIEIYTYICIYFYSIQVIYIIYNIKKKFTKKIKYTSQTKQLKNAALKQMYNVN